MSYPTGQTDPPLPRRTEPAVRQHAHGCGSRSTTPISGKLNGDPPRFRIGGTFLRSTHELRDPCSVNRNHTMGPVPKLRTSDLRCTPPTEGPIPPGSSRGISSSRNSPGNRCRRAGRPTCIVGVRGDLRADVPGQRGLSSFGTGSSGSFLDASARPLDDPCQYCRRYHAHSAPRPEVQRALFSYRCHGPAHWSERRRK